jgi:ureidoacrylate peracid hydrolase
MTTAVLVVDMQNGFLHPEGSLARASMGLSGSESAIEETAALLTAARADGLPVFYSRHVVSEGAPEMFPAWRAAAAPVLAVEPRMLCRGTWDAEVLDRLAPHAHDMVIDKQRYDAFLDTGLDAALRERGVDHVVVAGVLTNVCVESTVRSGIDRRFDMAVATDATAAYDGFHAPALAAMAALYATVAPWAELLREPDGPVPAWTWTRS